MPRNADLIKRLLIKLIWYYIIRAIEVYRLPVYSNVIYLRPDAGNNDPGKFAQNLERHNISIEYQVFRLIEMNGQEILDLQPVGLIPFTPAHETSSRYGCGAMASPMCSNRGWY